MIRLLFSPFELALTVATLTVALPICAVSLTVTQALNLEQCARGPIVNGSHSHKRWRHAALKADGPGPTTKVGMGHAGVGMQRRLSSTNSALIPVSEEEERDAWDDDPDETFHTCDEAESVTGDGGRKRHNTFADPWDFGDEDEAEDYSLTPRLLSNLFSLDGPGSNSPGMPLSPSLFTTAVDSSFGSLFDEPVPFTSPSSSFNESPHLSNSSPSTSPSLSTPGNSPPLPLVKPPRPSSPDPRQSAKARLHPHHHIAYAAQGLSYARVAGLPTQSMGGGTFQASEGTPLRGLGLHGEGVGTSARNTGSQARRM